MVDVHKQAVVSYTCQQMFDLVDDIEKYPEFLPWCASSKVVSRTDNEVVGELVLKAKGMTQSFTTRNHFIVGESVTMQLEEGPFKSFDGDWCFKARDDGGCQVSLDLSFEFANPMFAMMFGSVFNQVANKLMEAFLARADEVYA